MTPDDPVYRRFLAYLAAGFPSDEALALAEGRFVEWNAEAEKDAKEERDGTYR